MAELSEEDKKILRKELLKIGLRTVRGAKRRAPVDTGRLRSSITLADSTGIIQEAGPDARATDSVNTPSQDFLVRVGTNVSYAELIEFGTGNRKAQPFLRPAADAALNQSNLET